MIHLLDVASGHVMATIQAFREGVSCSSLAYSADGELLASGREGLKFKPLGRQPCPGDKLELEDNTGGVFIWSTSDHRKLAFVKEFVGSINDLAWSPREDVLAVADDVFLRLWSIEPGSGAVTPVAWFGIPTFRTTFSPDGRLATIPIRELCHPCLRATSIAWGMSGATCICLKETDALQPGSALCGPSGCPHQDVAGLL